MKGENIKMTVLACFLNGIMFGMIKLFYEIVPHPMNGLLYCTFLGFTITFAVGADKKQIKEYFGSIVVGVLWVLGYLGFEFIFLLFPIDTLTAKVLAFGIMSFLIEIINIRILNNTHFRYVPLQFSVVIGVFSQNGENIPYVLIALMIGILAAILSKQIYGRFLKRSPQFSKR